MVKSDNNDIKPIKSSISDEFGDGDGKYLAHAMVYSIEIKNYVADNFKKEITNLDVLNFALFICHEIVTAKKWDNQENLINDLTEIINDDSKLNEYIFTHLATIKAWNETVAELDCNNPDDVSESEFDELMNKYNEKYQYKAWNDEKKVLNMFHEKGKADGGV